MNKRSLFGLVIVSVFSFFIFTEVSQAQLPLRIYRNLSLSNDEIPVGSTEEISVFGQIEQFLSTPKCQPYQPWQVPNAHHLNDILSMNFRILDSDFNDTGIGRSLNQGINGDWYLSIPGVEVFCGEPAENSYFAEENMYEFESSNFKFQVNTLPVGEYRLNFYGTHTNCNDQNNQNNCQTLDFNDIEISFQIVDGETPSPESGTINVSSNRSTSWTIDGPTAASGNGTSGSYTVSPGSYTIYPASLNCFDVSAVPSSHSVANGETKNFDITYTDNGSCTEIPPGNPPVVDLKFNGSDGPVTNFTQGASGTLSWTVSNANTCTASGGWSGSKNASGDSESSGAINAQTTFTITCTNDSGDSSDSVTVSTGAASCVDNAAVVLAGIPAVLTPGQEVTFTADVDNTGDTSWYHGSYYKFEQKTSYDINPTYGHLPTRIDPVSYNGPNKSDDNVVWTFTLTAPEDEGEYTIQMQMKHYVGADFMKMNDGSLVYCDDPPVADVWFGQVGSDTFEVVAENQVPIGNLDTPTCSLIGGWAFDPDVTVPAGEDGNLDILVYRDGTNVTGTALFATTTTGLRQDVNAAYGITGDHGFTVSTPESIKDNNTHSLYAYAIDANDPNVIQLIGTQNINCPPTVNVELVGRDNAVGGSYGNGPITISYQGRVDLNWTATNATSCTASSSPAGYWSGAKSSSGGSETTGTLTPAGNITFTISCSNSGNSDSDSFVVTVSNPPTPSTPTSVTVTEPNYCTSGPAATVSWNTNGVTQSAYEVEIDDQASFNSPEIDTGKIVSSSNAYATSQGVLQFNKTYRARVRIWNQYDVPSAWAQASVCSGPGCQGGSSWQTPIYAYPNVNFSWSPNNPPKGDPVAFTDQTTFGFNGGTKQWSWNFGDGTTSNQQNPSKTYNTENSYYVTLTATDNANQACSLTKGPLNIQKQIPNWIEVAPR